MIEKYCIKCKLNARMKNRRYCEKCYKEDACARAKKRYLLYGRSFSNNICVACSSEFKAWRKKQLLCLSCFKLKKELDAQIISTNKYIYIGYNKTSKKIVLEHNYIASNVLGRKIEKDEAVHHMDNNCKNNSINNLIVISRSVHGKLHYFLSLQRVIFEKSKNNNSSNCWNNLIIPITTEWLKTENVNVIKLWEISQSES